MAASGMRSLCLDPVATGSLWKRNSFCQARVYLKLEFFQYLLAVSQVLKTISPFYKCDVFCNLYYKNSNLFCIFLIIILCGLFECFQIIHTTPCLVSFSEWASGEGIMLFFLSIDINSMFIEMSQLTHLDKRFAQESSVKSKIVNSSINLLLVEKLFLKNQTTVG